MILSVTSVHMEYFPISAFGQDHTLVLRLCPFAWRFIHLLTYRRIWLRMPGHQAINRSAVFVAFFCGLSFELRLSPRVLVWFEWKEQLLEKWFRCEKLKRIFVVQNLSRLQSTVSSYSFNFFRWHLGSVDAIPVQFRRLT